MLPHVQLLGTKALKGHEFFKRATSKSLYQILYSVLADYNSFPRTGNSFH